MAANSITSVIWSIEQKLKDITTIPLPIIVVIGDQKSGKRRVLEALAGLDIEEQLYSSLPLFIRIQNHNIPQTEITLEVEADESAGPITLASSKVISRVTRQAITSAMKDQIDTERNPMTLKIKKRGAPNLFFVDLPEIVGVPSQEIKDMLLKYMKPKETVILNIVSDTSDFTSCQSIDMLEDEKIWERMLIVVTCSTNETIKEIMKAIKSHSLKAGLGVMYVRNSIRNQTYDQLVAEEKGFFNNQGLSGLNKSKVGVPALTQKLLQIQMLLVANYLPSITKCLDSEINELISELNRLPVSESNTLATFMRLLNECMQTLHQKLINKESHEFNPPMLQHLHGYFVELLGSFNFADKFLCEEMSEIQSSITHSRSIFARLIEKKLEVISQVLTKFVDGVFNYLEVVAKSVLNDRFEGNYVELPDLIKQITSDVIGNMKNKFYEWAVQALDKENEMVFFTCDPDFLVKCNTLMGNCQEAFHKAILNHSPNTTIEGYGDVQVDHLHGYPDSLLDEAYKLKARQTVYLNLLIKRVVDTTAAQLRASIKAFVKTDLQRELVNGVISCEQDLERLLQPKRQEKED